jgi:hypothetical protein
MGLEKHCVLGRGMRLVYHTEYMAPLTAVNGVTDAWVGIRKVNVENSTLCWYFWLERHCLIFLVLLKVSHRTP